MPRRVLYDAEARVTASLLAGRFDVSPLPVKASAVGPDAVVLLSDSSEARRFGADVRVVAIVAADSIGPWPPDWYAVIPAGVSTAIMARTIDRAFDDLDRAADLAKLDRELSELNAIGIQLSAERDPAVLLETILRKAREITHSDAGSLYLVEDDDTGGRRLRFALTQNHSIDVPFYTTTLPMTRDSVAGYVALEGQSLNLDDAYALDPAAPFRINRSFDDHVGYRTKSMLVVPMRTPHNETIGVLQLINCKPSFALRLTSREDAERVVQPFGTRYEKLAASLASQAAVTLANRRMYDSIRQLFEGFVRASVTAIESRDPTTFGHSFRVADLTVGLAEAVERADRGPYGGVRFNADEIMEIRYASLLHDFGKVGVREHILVKAKKLYPGELDRIRQRMEIIKRGLLLRTAEMKLAHVLDKGRRGYTEHASNLDAELASYLQELDASLDHIVAANEPRVAATEATGAIDRIALRSFEDHLGERHAVITPEEARILTTARGSLTPEEFEQIQSHVVHTWEFLSEIPWTREFRRIPEIARSHHEKLDGRGYPDGMKADEIPVQSKMMTIADIYDALTAWDRPYKASLPEERALDMLREEQQANAIDGALLNLFIDARVYRRTSRR